MSSICSKGCTYVIKASLRKFRNLFYKLPLSLECVLFDIAWAINSHYCTPRPSQLELILYPSFFGVRIWLVKVLGRFSINYFRGLGLRIRV